MTPATSGTNCWIPDMTLLLVIITIFHWNCGFISTLDLGPDSVLPYKSPTTIIPCNTTKYIREEESVIVESPGFGKRLGGYPATFLCRWSIQSNKCNLVMTCPKFRLSDLFCLDYLEVQDAFGWNRRHCGLNSPTALKLDRKTVITFKTNSLPKFPGTGFRCRIDCEPKESHRCSGNAEKFLIWLDEPKRRVTVSTAEKQSNSTRHHQCQCGEGRRTRAPRIINGTSVFPQEFPWMVGLVDGVSGEIFCGGSLISDSLILTAAHCVHPRTPGSFYVILDQAGTGSGQNLTSRRPSSSRIYPIHHIYLHPNYNPVRLDFDAALLTLAHKINLTNSRSKPGSTQLAIPVPICLPPSSDSLRDYGNEKVSVCGFGNGAKGIVQTGQPLQLEKVNVTVMSDKYCLLAYPGRKIKPEKLCARAPFADACKGDSGSALYMTVWAKNKVPFHTHIGIVSSGTGCATHNPGIYIKTSKLLPWIVKISEAEQSGFCAN